MASQVKPGYWNSSVGIADWFVIKALGSASLDPVLVHWVTKITMPLPNDLIDLYRRQAPQNHTNGFWGVFSSLPKFLPGKSSHRTLT
jgi:hypothetical protein